ncbi:unnamed protein product [Sphagnum troendelagicum]|uniref:Uncharacterized protein n=1 Tax=Sphagnum troendelagicum TaxID=128251 RepID=A0ABP0TDK0_9BRYO
MVMGAPLEDARHLTQRYERLQQEADAQMVSERQRSESSSTPGGNVVAAEMYMPPPSYEDVKLNGGSQNAFEVAPVSKAAQKALYFLAEVASSTSQVCVYSCSVEDALCFMDMLLGKPYCDWETIL